MSHGESRHDGKQSPQIPEWQHETEQEQEVVQPTDYVGDAQLDKRSGSLIPAWIQRHSIHVCGKPVGADRTISGSELDQHLHLVADTRRLNRVDVKVGGLRSDWECEKD